MKTECNHCGENIAKVEVWYHSEALVAKLLTPDEGGDLIPKSANPVLLQIGGKYDEYAQLCYACATDEYPDTKAKVEALGLFDEAADFTDIAAELESVPDAYAA